MRLSNIWKRATGRLTLLGVCALLLSIRLSSQDSTARECIHAGWMLNVNSGELIPDVYVLVENGRIAAIERSAPAGSRPIDLSRLTLLPGLIDCHAHVLVDWKDLSDTASLRMSSAAAALQGVSNLRAWLQHGFTAIRDAGERDPYYAQFALRDGVRKGLIIGPHMLAAGGVLSITGGIGDADVLAVDQALPHRPNIVDTPAEMEMAVRRDIKYGADWIKLMATGSIVDAVRHPNSQQLSDAQIRIAVEVAHRAGRKVMAHAQSPAGIKAAVDAGVDSIEHGSLATDDTLRTMGARGTWLVPTLYALESLVQSGPASGMDQAAMDGARKAVQLRRTCFGRALQAHVKVAFGSDLGPAMLDKEFHSLVENGMTPLAAIQSATIHAAELIDMSDRIGTIEVGKVADLAGVAGNPLTDITAMGRVRFVMKQGHVMDKQ